MFVSPKLQKKIAAADEVDRVRENQQDQWQINVIKLLEQILERLKVEVR